MSGYLTAAQARELGNFDPNGIVDDFVQKALANVKAVAHKRRSIELKLALLTDIEQNRTKQQLIGLGFEIKFHPGPKNYHPTDHDYYTLEW